MFLKKLHFIHQGCFIYFVFIQFDHSSLKYYENKNPISIITYFNFHSTRKFVLSFSVLDSKKYSKDFLTEENS